MKDYNNELMHFGVPGMKWGVRRNRDKSSFNTSYKPTMLDNHGRLLAVNGKTVNRGNRQYRKASRAAMREMNAYRKANKKANWKDSLSVAGNKYEEVLSGNGNNKASRKVLAKQRKAILKDYNNTGRINRAKYNAKLNSGTLSGTQKHHTKQTYESMTKKYGKTTVDDALKWNKRRANIGTAIGAAAGLSLALVYNKNRGRI